MLFFLIQDLHVKYLWDWEESENTQSLCNDKRHSMCRDSLNGIYRWYSALKCEAFQYLTKSNGCFSVMMVYSSGCVISWQHTACFVYKVDLLSIFSLPPKVYLHVSLFRIWFLWNLLQLYRCNICDKILDFDVICKFLFSMNMLTLFK